MTGLEPERLRTDLARGLNGDTDGEAGDLRPGNYPGLCIMCCCCCCICAICAWYWFCCCSAALACCNCRFCICCCCIAAALGLPLTICPLFIIICPCPCPCPCCPWFIMFGFICIPGWAWFIFLCTISNACCRACICSCF